MTWEKMIIYSFHIKIGNKIYVGIVDVNDGESQVMLRWFMMEPMLQSSHLILRMLKKVLG
jgi:hypothetical protein